MTKWQEVISFLEAFRTQPIVVGCSGGLDSMTLLHFLHKHGFRIIALHINYHQRGVESDLDQQLVADFCTKQQIEFYHRDYATDEKGNFQELARKFRYQFFEEIATKNNAVIAVAHHQDDQVETFCMNLMRNSGMMGLAAMLRINGRVIRPFLNLSKQELLEYAQNNKLEWRDDKSNFETKYLRNKWRLEFIPLLVEKYPTIKESILTLIDVFQRNQEALTAKMIPYANLIRNTNQITIEQLHQLTDNELFELWRQLNQNPRNFHRFKEILEYKSGKKIEVREPYKSISRTTDSLLWTPNKTIQSDRKLLVEKINSLPTKFDKNCIYLNPEKIQGKLILRPWQLGDRINSIGVKGSQLVSKIIKDAKIPLSKRDDIYIVKDDLEIHWVVGLKIGRNAISKTGDHIILKISINVNSK